MEGREPQDKAHHHCGRAGYYSFSISGGVWQLFKNLILKLNKMSVTATFKHVSYLWDEAKAASLEGDEVALLLYRSNLLGADLRLTNYGGGNTSCKVMAKDPLTGKQTEVMWVKGSGGDLGTLK